MTDLLTTTETKVMALVAQGYSNPEICQALGMGDNTVKSAVHHIFTKFNVNNRVRATLKWQEINR